MLIDSKYKCLFESHSTQAAWFSKRAKCEKEYEKNAGNFSVGFLFRVFFSFWAQVDFEGKVCEHTMQMHAHTQRNLLAVRQGKSENKKWRGNISLV